jgi:hypothetical protein
METRLGFEGGRQLEAALMGLSRSTSRSLARRVLQKAGQKTADKSNALAPVPDDPRWPGGRLSGSYVVSSVLTKSQRRAAKAARSNPNSVEVYVGTADPAGLLQEFGTARHVAQPHLRPAWDATARAVFEAIRAQMVVAVERARRRAAARALRAR